MTRRLTIAAIAALTLAVAAASQQDAETAQDTLAAPPPATPADGYNLHIMAPHIYGDRLVDPMHHWCKVKTPGPYLECLMYESTDPDARLTGIEYALPKTVTRREIALEDWNRDWHDHAVEIAAGLVKLPDTPPEEAERLAAAAATTDGLVFYLWPPDERAPDREVSIAQAISHNLLTPVEYTRPLRTAGN